MNDQKTDAQKMGTNAARTDLPLEKPISGNPVDQSDVSSDPSDRGMHGEMLRPSEREPSYTPTADKAEGER